MRKGINLLEDLSNRHPEGKRDYIYYLAFGHARLQDYTLSLKFIEKFLQIEPENEQAKLVYVFVPAGDPKGDLFNSNWEFA